MGLPLYGLALCALFFFLWERVLLVMRENTAMRRDQFRMLVAMNPSYYKPPVCNVCGSGQVEPSPRQAGGYRCPACGEPLCLNSYKMHIPGSVVKHFSRYDIALGRANDV